VTDVRFEAVTIYTGSLDKEGGLAFVSDLLVAVLVRLSAQHGAAAGSWFLEHGFGVLDHPAERIFASLDDARAWLESVPIDGIGSGRGGADASVTGTGQP
jgi:hypothetical protein